MQNDADDNETHQQATSNNVTTDSDPALEFDARENDKLTSNEEENDDPLNEYRAPVCETCLRVNHTKLSSAERLQTTTYIKFDLLENWSQITY